MSWDGIHDLIQRAKLRTDRGEFADPEGWRLLEEMSRPFMLSLAQRLLGPSWPVRSLSDLTQDTWLRVSRSLETFRGGSDDANTGAAFRAFLKTTMRHLHLDQVPPPGLHEVNGVLGALDSSGAGGIDPPAHGSTPSQHVARNEWLARVREVVANLDDPLDRRLVELHYFERRSLREIEKLMPDQTYDQLRYRRDRLVERLGYVLKDLE